MESHNNNSNSSLSRFKDIEFAAEYLGLSKSAVYQKTSTGALVSYKSGKYLRFLIDDLDSFILNSRTNKLK